MGLLNAILRVDKRNKALPKKIKAIVAGSKDAEERQVTWRRNPKYFSPGKHIAPGITDIASIWFQAGHSVNFSCSRYLPRFLITHVERCKYPRSIKVPEKFLVCKRLASRKPTVSRDHGCGPSNHTSRPIPGGCQDLEASSSKSEASPGTGTFPSCAEDMVCSFCGGIHHLQPGNNLPPGCRWFPVLVRHPGYPRRLFRDYLSPPITQCLLFLLSWNCDRYRWKGYSTSGRCSYGRG
jgi:hypothetical protein